MHVVYRLIPDGARHPYYYYILHSESIYGLIMIHVHNIQKAMGVDNATDTESSVARPPSNQARAIKLWLHCLVDTSGRRRCYIINPTEILSGAPIIRQSGRLLVPHLQLSRFHMQCLAFCWNSSVQQRGGPCPLGSTRSPYTVVQSRALGKSLQPHHAARSQHSRPQNFTSFNFKVLARMA